MRILLALLLCTPAFAVELPSPSLAELTLSPTSSSSWSGGTYVGMQQSLAGLPVYGAPLKLDYDVRGELRAVHGDVIDTGPFSLTPNVAQDEAIARARAAVFEELGSDELWPARAELSVLVFRGSHLAWSVDVGVAEPLGHWQVMVDAHDGSLLGFRPKLFTAQA